MLNRSMSLRIPIYSRNTPKLRCTIEEYHCCLKRLYNNMHPLVLQDGRKVLYQDVVAYGRCLRVSRLYNTVISCIIEGSSDWSLSNGYRNILATMGISLDGMYRNKIGEMAEKLIKDRIMAWLNANSLIESSSTTEGLYVLSNNVQMRYGSEPDVSFRRNERLIATIEIKGGTDPAGALERLGAMTKSFAETPPSCVNFLIAGVITTEMRSRLDDMGVVKVYELSRLAQDGVGWDEFINELFHHAVRII